MKIFCAGVALAAALLCAPSAGLAQAAQAAQAAQEAQEARDSVLDSSQCRRTYMTCLSQAGEELGPKAQCAQVYQACQRSAQAKAKSYKPATSKPKGAQ
ncbi:hypothetical protein [Fundidesulfovibrio soli]|uniref:hypothetical protein n=1 Tax=Fundidesulfovibrio soli TaxID=2922716 RepID=UPI001FAF4835|nr:hypothetical protein [Fundidesulfovibrio soli]